MTPLVVFEWTMVTFVVCLVFFGIMAMFSAVSQPRKKKKKKK